MKTSIEKRGDRNAHSSPWPTAMLESLDGLWEGPALIKQEVPHETLAFQGDPLIHGSVCPLALEGGSSSCSVSSLAAPDVGIGDMPPLLVRPLYSTPAVGVILGSKSIVVTGVYWLPSETQLASDTTSRWFPWQQSLPSSF